MECTDDPLGRDGFGGTSMKLWILALTLIGCSSANFSGGPGQTSGQPKNADAQKPVPRDTDSNADKNTPNDGTDSAAADRKNPIISDGGEDSPHQVPQFGLLVNDLQCSFCHLKINGDIASTTDVSPFWYGSHGVVDGAWFVAGDFKGDTPTPVTSSLGTNVTLGIQISLTVSDSIREQDHTAPAIPKNKVTKKAEFPVIDWVNLPSKMQGSLKSSNIEFKDTYVGNLVLVGTDSSPIEVKGEVLIQGDLVIKGRYKGMANIYVTGNIYIPGDLLATESPFPYSSNPTEAMEQARVALANNLDALGLASAQSIIISDFDTHAPGNVSVFNHEWTPKEDSLEALKVNQVYDWFPGGKPAFAKLFDKFNLGCEGKENRGRNDRSFSRVDAYLYAAKAVGGRANLNSYAINGGVIANHFHIIAGAEFCPDSIHPVHGLNARYSYVNYDWRMKLGLLLLKQLEDYFYYPTP